MCIIAVEAKMRFRRPVQGLRDIILDIMVEAVIKIGGGSGCIPLVIDGAIYRQPDGSLFTGKIIYPGAKGMTAVRVPAISMLEGIPVKG